MQQLLNGYFTVPWRSRALSGWREADGAKRMAMGVWSENANR